ncbi:FkbM family methyltransferase [Paraglaciecola sp.]|uniref:FkbM family methyltransferase n=1 Tax=Paraglaciecola sp. TaxID=1920173 RepID=UPI0030F39F22
MPTEHGLLSDLKFYSKKGRLFRYLKGEVKGVYYRNRTQWSLMFDDYIVSRFDPFRVLAKRFEKSLPKLDTNHIKVGNYYLDKRINYPEAPVIYSMGVLTDISFDRAAADYYNTKVLLFDPAPVAIEFMAKQHDPRLIFQACGVWIEDKVMEFMLPKESGRSPSMFMHHDGGIFSAPCKSIATIMGELKHQKIDILKMDIEGAALPILEHLLQQDIPLPSQVVVEFENVNPSLLEFCDFYLRLNKLIDHFTGHGFTVVNLPREYNFYRSVELLFSRNDK